MVNIMEEKNTEQVILNAARKVFIEKGKDGAKMQEIADTAGINKSLLHYYFRSKEKLFLLVIKDTLHNFFPNLERIFCSDRSLEEKIRNCVNSYITLLCENPFIPPFIIHELNRSPEKIMELVQSSGIRFDIIGEALGKDLKSNSINITPYQLFANIISLCVFPIAIRPLMTNIFFKGDKNKFEEFIEERKKGVADFIINSIIK